MRLGAGDRPPSLGAGAAPARGLRLPLLVIAVGLLFAMVPFLSGLVGALILFAVTRRLHYRVAKVLPSRVSAFIIATGTLVAILVPGAWLVTTIVSEASLAVRGLTADDLTRWAASTPLADSDVSKAIATGATSIIGWLSGRAVQLVGGLTTTVLNVLLALFGLYYLLLDAPSLWARVKRVLSVSEEIADLLIARFAAVTDALLVGTMLTCVLQGTIVGIAFALVGLHPAVLWGFVTACAAVLPALGSAFVWLPGIIVLLAEHRLGAAALLALLGGGLASNIDNVVRLAVYRRVSGIHPMLTLVGAIAGVRTLGLVGAFIGPLVLSCFVELLSIYDEARRDLGPRAALAPQGV
jgi:predicted PurR-regulated permease PerM